MRIAFLGLFWLGALLWAQLDTVQIHSPTIVCQTCRRTLVKGLSTQRGIRYVEVDVPKKWITVVYRKDKTSPERIRQAIARLGYDADTVRRDPAAFERLPACCKVDTPH